jgi:ankyrin repeat protein
MLDRASFDLLVTNLTLLVQYGGKPDFPDSEGRTALMYAVMSNDRRLVAYLVSNYKVSRFEVNGQDNSGKTVAHYLVQPLSYGSYENAALLEYLFAECNLVLDLKDINDRTPLDLACN